MIVSFRPEWTWPVRIALENGAQLSQCLLLSGRHMSHFDKDSGSDKKGLFQPASYCSWWQRRRQKKLKDTPSSLLEWRTCYCSAGKLADDPLIGGNGGNVHHWAWKTWADFCYFSMLNSANRHMICIWLHPAIVLYDVPCHSWIPRTNVICQWKPPLFSIWQAIFAMHLHAWHNQIRWAWCCRKG